MLRPVWPPGHRPERSAPERLSTAPIGRKATVFSHASYNLLHCPFFQVFFPIPGEEMAYCRQACSAPAGSNLPIEGHPAFQPHLTFDFTDHPFHSPGTASHNSPYVVAIYRDDSANLYTYPIIKPEACAVNRDYEENQESAHEDKSLSTEFFERLSSVLIF